MAQASRWYVYKVATRQMAGPVSGAQIKQWLDAGTLTAADMVGPSPQGPWSSLGDWLSAETPSSGLSGLATFPEPSASGPPQSVGGKTLADPEYLRRQRQRARQQAKRLTYYLILGIAVLCITFILVLAQPFGSRGGRRAPTPVTSRQPGPKDPAQEVVAKGTVDLESVLVSAKATPGGSTPTKGEGKVQAPREPVARFVQAAKEFGGSGEKRQDTHGGVEMRVQTAEIGPLRLRRGERVFQTKNPYYIIRLRIANQNQNGSVTYHPAFSGLTSATLSWAGGEPRSPYVRQGFQVENQQQNPVRLGPGEAAMDVYVFSLPPDTVHQVVFTVPGRAVGVEEDFVFLLTINEKGRAEAFAGRAPGTPIEEESEASIGPLGEKTASQPAVSAKSAEAEFPEEEEEALPIPGLHDESGQSLGDRSSEGPTSSEQQEEEERLKEELRRKSEELQEALERQKQKTSGTGAPSQRGR